LLARGALKSDRARRHLGRAGLGEQGAEGHYEKRGLTMIMAAGRRGPQNRDRHECSDAAFQRLPEGGLLHGSEISIEPIENLLDQLHRWNEMAVS